MESGRQLSEVVIKQVTGGEPISARFLYGEYFDFTPSFKVFLATNHKPQIKNQDYGIWRRLRLIPFTVTIPENERDPKLVEKLDDELPGILNWALEGVRKWQQDGLGYPDEIREATDEYKDDMDVLADFLVETCDIGPGQLVSLADLLTAYKNWCSQNAVKPVGRTTFGELVLMRKGIEKRKINTAWIWRGIGIKPPQTDF
jgi:putative DNA primase/helicase